MRPNSSPNVQPSNAPAPIPTTSKNAGVVALIGVTTLGISLLTTRDNRFRGLRLAGNGFIKK
jgi:hypothetical protein